MEILIAEDEKKIANSLKKSFAEEGHHAIIALDGEKALKLIKEIVFDIILLDWRMPKVNGLDVLKNIRKEGIKTPIILLTALSDISNKVEALNAGADDYITKPFSFEEVLARINAVLRRSAEESNIIKCENFNLDLINRIIVSADKKTKLTDKEFELLKYFISKKGVIVSKDELCANVWGINFNPHTNIVEVTIKNLRKKLEEATCNNYIKTIYGEGYLFISE